MSAVFGKAEMRIGWFFTHEKARLDIFWLRDESQKASDNLPNPDVLTQELVIICAG